MFRQRELFFKSASLQSARGVKITEPYGGQDNDDEGPACDEIVVQRNHERRRGEGAQGTQSGGRGGHKGNGNDAPTTSPVPPQTNGRDPGGRWCGGSRVRRRWPSMNFPASCVPGKEPGGRAGRGEPQKVPKAEKGTDNLVCTAGKHTGAVPVGIAQKQTGAEAARSQLLRRHRRRAIEDVVAG